MRDQLPGTIMGGFNGEHINRGLILILSRFYLIVGESGIRSEIGLIQTHGLGSSSSVISFKSFGPHRFFSSIDPVLS